VNKLLVVALVSFVAGSAVTASAVAPPWRVFATGSDSGTYGSYANASAGVVKPKGLAIRATSAPGKTIDVSFSSFCDGEVKDAPSGRLIVITTGSYSKCTLNGSANTDYSGRVKVELLRR
jgi:hypothetical protein